jgi:hypothetical protein
MRVRITIMVVTVLTLPACATWEEARLPDGSMGYNIHCEQGTMPECFHKAAQLCGSTNYDITHRDRRPMTDPRLLLAVRCRTAA